MRSRVRCTQLDRLQRDLPHHPALAFGLGQNTRDLVEGGAVGGVSGDRGNGHPGAGGQGGFRL